MNSKGLLHNDIKGANIGVLLDETGKIKGIRLLDFGMATSIGGECKFSYESLQNAGYFDPRLKSKTHESKVDVWDIESQMYQVLDKHCLNINEKHQDLAGQYTGWEGGVSGRPALEKLYGDLHKKLMSLCSMPEVEDSFEGITTKFDLPEGIERVSEKASGDAASACGATSLGIVPRIVGNKRKRKSFSPLRDIYREIKLGRFKGPCNGYSGI